MNRLCTILKNETRSGKTTNSTISIDNYREISYIALREGVLPTVLYFMCVMNIEIFNDHE